jgi:hypothetical protein
LGVRYDCRKRGREDEADYDRQRHRPEQVRIGQQKRWYRHEGVARLKAGIRKIGQVTVPKNTAAFGIGVLLVLVFSNYVYLVSLSNFFTFFPIEKGPRLDSASAAAPLRIPTLQRSIGRPPK